jgi:UDPglucose 6-dehydrogenase
MNNIGQKNGQGFKIVIIGYGVVGNAIKQLFNNALIFDPAFAEQSASKKDINAADAAFICVPTPKASDGSCDISIVEEVVAWLTTPLIIIRSTISPGTTDRLKKKYPNKHIVFMPEYIGGIGGTPAG